MNELILNIMRGAITVCLFALFVALVRLGLESPTPQGIYRGCELGIR